MTVREVRSLLEKNGFIILRSKGGHFQYGKGKLRVTVSEHTGDVKKGTLHRILKDAGLK
jgi:predicted RNA binding protein YcfA (HicA-like mRNA interferase family)